MAKKNQKKSKPVKTSALGSSSLELKEVRPLTKTQATFFENTIQVSLRFC